VERRPATCARRSVVVPATVCLALLAACEKPASPSPYYLLVDTKEGVRPVHVERVDASAGRIFRIVSGDERIGYGRSGSPLYASSGEVVGGVNAYVTSSGEMFKVQPIDRIRRAMERAQAAPLPDLLSLGNAQGIVQMVRPGQSVAFLWTWGDVSLGFEGAVTELDGPWVAAFAHAVGEDRGPVLGFLAISRAITEVLDTRGTRTLLAEPTQVVGSFVWSAAESYVGVLGRYPERTTVTITWPEWPEWDRRFETVRPWKYGRPAVWEGTRVALEPLDLLEPRSLDEAHVSIAVDGEDRVYPLAAARSMAKGPGTYVLQQAIALGDARFGGKATDGGPETLAIVVSLPIQRSGSR